MSHEATAFSEKKKKSPESHTWKLVKKSGLLLILILVLVSIYPVSIYAQNRIKFESNRALWNQHKLVKIVTVSDCQIESSEYDAETDTRTEITTCLAMSVTQEIEYIFDLAEECINGFFCKILYHAEYNYPIYILNTRSNHYLRMGTLPDSND